MNEDLKLIAFLSAVSLASLAIGQQPVTRTPSPNQFDSAPIQRPASSGAGPTGQVQSQLASTTKLRHGWWTNNPTEWWTNRSPAWWARVSPQLTNVPPNWWTTVPPAWWTNVPAQWWAETPANWWTNLPSDAWLRIPPSWWASQNSILTNKSMESYRPAAKKGGRP